MNKPNRNFLLVLTIILGASLLLFGCDLTGGKPSASTPINSGAGNLGGPAQVSVSTGVILLTPGAPFPTLDINHIPGLTPLPATETPNPNATPTFGDTPTPGPTVDVASLHLPQGLTIYPGATNLDTSGLQGANGMNTLIFYTKDSTDQVITYYNQQLNQTGWTISSGPANTPGPADRQVWSWTNSTFTIVSIMVTDDPQGGTDVTVMWLAL